jgi:hypothetical protein
VFILRWSWLITLAAVCGALAAAGCAAERGPVTDEVGPPGSALPDLSPTLYMPPLYGTATPWPLTEAVAQSLQRFDIAVATHSGNAASYVLYSLAEAAPTADGRQQVTIHWDLVEPRGELIGTATQTSTMTAEAWQNVPPGLTAMADDAAARILHILPGAQWEPTDPSRKVAAREERRKLEARRALYRRMAARGGLGPLSQRIFLHAEQQERRTADQAGPAQAAVAPAVAPAAAPVIDGTPGRLEAAPVVALTDGHFAELGAFPDEGEARAHWGRLRRAYGALFRGHGFVLAPVELGERGTFYRVHAGPFEKRAEVVRFCRELVGVGFPCFVQFAANGNGSSLLGAIRVTDIPEPVAITEPSSGGG